MDRVPRHKLGSGDATAASCYRRCPARRVTLRATPSITWFNVSGTVYIMTVYIQTVNKVAVWSSGSTSASINAVGPTMSQCYL